METSSAHSCMMAHLCVTPGAAELVILTETGPVPNSDSSTTRTSAEVMQCAHGYSGCGGVSINGSQPASRLVASLPSRSPLRIAVMALQKLNVYFASNPAM